VIGDPGESSLALLTMYSSASRSRSLSRNGDGIADAHLDDAAASRHLVTASRSFCQLLTLL